MADDLNEIERQLLEYLASKPKGAKVLICEPHLSTVAGWLALDTRRLLTDVYEGPGGCRTARITDAGRALVNG